MSQNTLNQKTVADPRGLPTQITTIEDLGAYLNAGLQLEHATIPPYLTALYSLHPGGNSDAQHILRVVVVEEMLHLSLVANVMNAVGLAPDLTVPDFVPVYPAYLPNGEIDFEVGLQPFGLNALTTFLNIERPAKAPTAQHRLLPTPQVSDRQVLAASPLDPNVRYYSIGEFYDEVERGLRYLDAAYRAEGKDLFSGDPARQITPEYFYSGGGQVVPVSDLDSALRALGLIAEQGEGLGGGIYDSEGELSHYYRFEQLQLGRYYQNGDKGGHPSGPPIQVDFSAVYPVTVNARLAQYPPDSELYAAAATFNRTYADFLAFVTDAFTGRPELLLDAVPWMFRLRDGMNQLLRNPFPGRPGLNAAPTFEVPAGIREQS
jgi:hypothetical protein